MKSKNHDDPFAKREAEKYSNPIPSREYIIKILEAASGPLNLKSIIRELEISSDESKEALRRRMIAMVRDGQLVSTRRGFGIVEKMSLVRGIVQGHKDGFGFVIPADGSQDVFLSNRQMRRVFNGDEVLVRPEHTDHRGRIEGSIVEVLKHNTSQLVGRFFDDQGVYYVQPDNPRIVQEILIPQDQIADGKDGQLVTVEIIQQPSKNHHAMGRVSEVLGEHLAPGMEIDVAIRSHDIPHEWPQDVLKETQSFSSLVQEKDKAYRVDLRELPLITIDGEDARDFDDAVYCERKASGGWRLYVAIADVSHYVSPESELDSEARARGNSVYFPDFVVPMLPEVLSNGLCSLNPDVDRLCMVCEMTISAAGRISGYKFYEGVMHSYARMTYTQVGKYLENKQAGKVTDEHDDTLCDLFDELYALFAALFSQRRARGAIEFETVETRIIFDKERKIQQIVPVLRNDAHRIIEECMLAANVCAAKFLETHAIESLYRVHEPPQEEKLENLKLYLAELGISFKGEAVSSQEYGRILSFIKPRPDAHIIQTVMLRSMNQALYQPENKGHFGLSYGSYTHFTSPIRRYPDLMVHRAIRAVIRSNMETTKVVRVPGVRLRRFESLYKYNEHDMAVMGEQCSMTERRADDATRDVISWLKCEYLQQHVGEEFNGIVSSVTGFGLFVELIDLYVEGLVHITSLPQDYYRYDVTKHRLVGERTAKVFRLGDALKVRVARVNLDERKVDFELIEYDQRRRGKNKKEKVVVSEKAKTMAQEYLDSEPVRKVRKRKIESSDAETSHTKKQLKKANNKAKVKKPKTRVKKNRSKKK